MHAFGHLAFVRFFTRGTKAAVFPLGTTGTWESLVAIVHHWCDMGMFSLGEIQFWLDLKLVESRFCKATCAVRFPLPTQWLEGFQTCNPHIHTRTLVFPVRSSPAYRC